MFFVSECIELKLGIHEENDNDNCDHDDDPYNINEGFMWAHMGWLMFKLRPPLPIDNARDLEKDALVMWQHKYINLLAVGVGLVMPTIVAGLYYGTWIGALGGFLIPGVLRIVAVQHSTFCINSLCHTVENSIIRLNAYPLFTCIQQLVRLFNNHRRFTILEAQIVVLKPGENFSN